MGKNKGFAAILNFLTWGLGYIYTGKAALGALLFIAMIVQHVPVFYLGWTAMYTMPYIFYPVSQVLLSLIFAYDGYRTVKVNK